MSRPPIVSRVVEVQLPNGTTALVQASEAGGPTVEKVAWPDRFDLAEVTAALDGIAQALKAAVDKAEPVKWSVELGIELVLKSGKLTALLVEGQGTAALKVTLEWQRPTAPH